jgi:hypothetical protein
VVFGIPCLQERLEGIGTVVDREDRVREMKDFYWLHGDKGHYAKGVFA